MKTRSYLLVVCFFVLNVGLAQDYHFSQFDANPFYVNPALTGERLDPTYNGIQFNANYRDQMSQYTKFPSSFKSMAAGLEEPLSSKFSLGQFVYNDRSTTGTFNTTGFILSCANRIIDQKVDNKNNHNLSFGIQVGILNKVISPGKFTYETQYSTNSADGFDRSLPTGETFARQSYYNLNVNFGVYYRVSTKNKKFSGFGGFAIYNITRPNESFLEGGYYSALPLRFNVHGGFVGKVTNLLTLMPQVLYMTQANARELNVNLLLFSKMEGKPYETIYGFGTRNKDAIIFQLGLRTKGITVRASYDLVTSDLKSYRNQGFELSLVKTFKKKAKPLAAENTASSNNAEALSSLSTPPAEMKPVANDPLDNTINEKAKQEKTEKPKKVKKEKTKKKKKNDTPAGTEPIQPQP